MDKFEEEFPSLVKVKCRTFTDKCLMKTCLDKKRVTKAIYEVTKHEQNKLIIVTDFLKELNLCGEK